VSRSMVRLGDASYASYLSHWDRNINGYYEKGVFTTRGQH
jgi:hypothetical protein